MFDILIKNALCFDGTGAEPVRTDIGVSGGRIAAVDNGIAAEAARVIDASELAAAPGFIDTHSHSDLAALSEPLIPNKTTQGITTDIIGQDGMSLAPLTEESAAPWKLSIAGLEGNYDVEWTWRSPKEYLDALDAQNLGPNLAWLAPYSNLRMCTVGFDDRRASARETEDMKRLLEQALDCGACGLSTGLVYPPGSYADRDEMAEVASVLAKRGLPFVVHQRNESSGILSSMDEMLYVGRKSGCHIHFSHFKIGGFGSAHLASAVLEKLENARRDVSVSFDQYPYTAGSTTLGFILPQWAHDGGAEKCLARLADAACRERMKSDIISGNPPEWENCAGRGYSGVENIYITFVKTEKNADLVGKNLVEAGEMRGTDPLDAAFDLLLQERMSVGMYHFYGTEELLETFMAHPLQNPCTDGILGTKPHPRVYGAFPRLLGRYVRERGVMDLKTAVHKCTGRPATIFRLRDRGFIREGAFADITLFSPETIIDRATFEDPCQYSDGVRFLIVNGRLAIDGGSVTGERTGRVLRD